jgi:hypothetical protein
MKEFLDLLAQLKQAHKEALEDDEALSALSIEMATLKSHIKSCMDGHKDWAECRTELLDFLSRSESILQTNDSVLYGRIAYLRGKLEAISFETD